MTTYIINNEKIKSARTGTYNNKNGVYDSVTPEGGYCIAAEGGIHAPEYIQAEQVLSPAEVDDFYKNAYKGIFTKIVFNDIKYVYIVKKIRVYTLNKLGLMTYETKNGSCVPCFKAPEEAYNILQNNGITVEKIPFKMWDIIQNVFDKACKKALSENLYKKVCTGFAGYVAEYYCNGKDFDLWKENFLRLNSLKTKNGANYDLVGKNGLDRFEIKSSMRNYPEEGVIFLHHKTTGRSKSNGFHGDHGITFDNYKPDKYQAAVERLHSR